MLRLGFALSLGVLVSGQVRNIVSQYGQGTDSSTYDKTTDSTKYGEGYQGSNGGYNGGSGGNYPGSGGYDGGQGGYDGGQGGYNGGHGGHGGHGGGSGGIGSGIGDAIGNIGNCSGGGKNCGSGGGHGGSGGGHGGSGGGHGGSGGGHGGSGGGHGGSGGGHGGSGGGHGGSGGCTSGDKNCGSPSQKLKNVSGNVSGAFLDVVGMPLDGSMLPIGGDPTEDLKLYAGQCKAIVNLVQIVPTHAGLDCNKFAHIKRMVHFMLDGFVINEYNSHAAVITSGGTTETVFGLDEPEGQSNIEARRRTANLKQGTGVFNATDALRLAYNMLEAHQRDHAINVVIIHTDGDFTTDSGLSSVLQSLQNTPKMIPIVVSYGQRLFSSQNELNAMVKFAECLDLEFCPNLIPARWSPASLISTQLAVKQYIATAVRAVPQGQGSQQGYSASVETY